MISQNYFKNSVKLELMIGLDELDFFLFFLVGVGGWV